MLGRWRMHTFWKRWLAIQRCWCWIGVPGRIPEGWRRILLRVALAVMREKRRLPTSSVINQTVRLSGSNRSNLQVQAALTAIADVIKESVWFIFVCFSIIVKFSQLSLVIFVGEELTVFGFVREECEKNFENHWSSVFNKNRFPHRHKWVTVYSESECCVFWKAVLFCVFLMYT